MDITVQELKQKLDKGEKFVFIDVREKYEFEEFNLEAKLIPLGEFERAIAGFEDHKDEEIVIHCRSGARSGMAQQLMQIAGFTNVRNLTGGVLAWQSAFSNK
ncbi:MAG: rhodanese-related sulfurtransferase [Saprospiraceae bacterium]|jgi:rhodanese-related sulfurtransferase